MKKENDLITKLVDDINFIKKDLINIKKHFEKRIWSLEHIFKFKKGDKVVWNLKIFTVIDSFVENNMFGFTYVNVYELLDDNYIKYSFPEEKLEKYEEKYEEK